jgi:ABC-2 type transport system permease protein
MRKVWAVIRREFVERVRNKWFLISTVLGPLFMLGVGVLPALLMSRGGRVNHIVIVDASAGGTLAERMRSQLVRSGRFTPEILRASDTRMSAVEDSLAGIVRAEALDGYLAISSATIEAGTAEYRGRNVSSLTDMAALEGALRQSVVVERLTKRGVDPAVVQEAQGRINLKTERISRQGKGGESGQASFFLGYGVGIVLYMVILLYGINVMRSVIEEKQTRIIEILVSSLKPFQLMLGKVLGVGAVGLFQFGIWTLTGRLLVQNRTRILTGFHVQAAAMNSFQMPSISGQLLAVAIGYFLLGYLLYSALFAMVGAACNTESEAQQAQQPVMMLLVASLLISIGALTDPSGPLAVGASLVPFSAPILMPVRVATSDVAPTQLALSLAIMAATVLVVVWGAARVYRIGILMYGKRPNIKELLRWARQS